MLILRLLDEPAIPWPSVMGTPHLRDELNVWRGD